MSETTKTTEGAATPTVPGGLRGRVTIDFDACRLDGACAEACPTPALTLTADPQARRGTLTLDLGQCVFCGLCADACDNGAVRLDGLIELAVRDRADLITTAHFAEERTPKAKRGEDDRDDRRGDDDTGQRSRRRIHRLLGRSLKTFHIDAGSCNGCEAELIQAVAPEQALARFGLELTWVPQLAELLLITGPIPPALAPVVHAAHAQMPAGAQVLAVGACAIGGGIYRDAQGQPRGVEGWLDADVYVPGCPPSPRALAHGLELLLDRIEPGIRKGTWYGRYPDRIRS